MISLDPARADDDGLAEILASDTAFIERVTFANGLVQSIQPTNAP